MAHNVQNKTFCIFFSTILLYLRRLKACNIFKCFICMRHFSKTTTTSIAKLIYGRGQAHWTRRPAAKKKFNNNKNERMHSVIYEYSALWERPAVKST